MSPNVLGSTRSMIPHGYRCRGSCGKGANLLLGSLASGMDMLQLSVLIPGRQQLEVI